MRPDLDCAECGHGADAHVHISPHPCRFQLPIISNEDEQLCGCKAFVWQNAEQAEK
jgi:hypothetical protein